MKQIDAFLTVARYRNLSRASKALYISNSALIKSLKYMEHVLEFPLYTRGKQGIELTDEGAYLAIHLSAVCEDYKKAVDNAKKINTSIRQTLNVVVPSAFDADENFEKSAKILKAFSQAHPDILINIVLDSLSDLRQTVRMRSADIAFTPDYVLYGLEGFEIKQISKMKQYIAMSRRLPCARVKKLDLKQLENEVFYQILVSDIILEKKMFVEECEKYGFRPKRVDFINDYQTFMHNIKEGLGISICGRIKNYDEKVSIKYYPLPECDGTPNIVLVLCAAQNSLVAQKLIAFIDMYGDESVKSGVEVEGMI